MLSNLYLNEVDRMLERAKELTGKGTYTYVEYARFADDLVVLIDDGHWSQKGLFEAVERRLREEFARLGVEINEEKSRRVDLQRGESFGFLGFDFRRVRTRQGRWRAHYTPKLILLRGQDELNYGMLRVITNDWRHPWRDRDG